MQKKYHSFIDVGYVQCHGHYDQAQGNRFYLLSVFVFLIESVTNDETGKMYKNRKHFS